jgi:hypothetical protein
VADAFEQEITLLSEGSRGHSWVNGRWEGRAEKKQQMSLSESVVLVLLV